MSNITPPNSTPFERGFANAVLKPIIPKSAQNIWSPEFCPELLLPWLAWGLGVDVWRSDWTSAQKRFAISKSAIIKRSKGTVKAVKEAVSAFGGSIILKEWFEHNPRTTPGTFSLFLALPTSGIAPTQEYLNSVIAAIDAAKRLSAHYTFLLAANYSSKIGLCAIGRTTQFIRINALFKPSNGGELTYLTDAEDNFLADSGGNLLIDNLS